MMAHQMGGFDADRLRTAFDIPQQFSLMAMVSVGYPAEISTLSGEVLERETAPRTRRPLGELFFSGAWGKPVV